jgi:type IV pilus assembly protein PilO
MNLRDIRLASIPRPIQILIFAVLILCLGGIFYFYHLKGIIKKRESLKKENVKLERIVEQGTAIENRLNLFKQELARLEERLAELQRILPGQKETPEMLENVQQMAASSNLKITKFMPKQIVPRVFYSDWPIHLELEGNYNGLGLFFQKISQATRIIDVRTISITGIEGSTDESKTLTASCIATAFVYRGEQETLTPVESQPEKKKPVVKIQEKKKQEKKKR